MKAVPLITCVGEPLVDFVATVSNVTLAETPGFVKVCGGEAANVAIGIARLGGRAAFIGKVGDDSFGRFIVRELKKANVDVQGVRADKRFRTRLAFVSMTSAGERDFEFWESNPAGEQLRYEDVPMAGIARSKIVNIGPLLLLKDPARSTAFKIAHEARKRGCDVAFDPNLRFPLWKSYSEMKRVTRAMVRQCTVLRLNADEAMYLTGTADVPEAARKLSSLGPEVVVVTLGHRGSYYRVPTGAGFVKGFNIKPVDTTGCGDGFLAGVLWRMAPLDHGAGSISTGTMEEVCMFGNAVGALTALKRGAVRALPSGRQVNRFLRAHRSSRR